MSQEREPWHTKIPLLWATPKVSNHLYKQHKDRIKSVVTVEFSDIENKLNPYHENESDDNKSWAVENIKKIKNT